MDDAERTEFRALLEDISRLSKLYAQSEAIQDRMLYIDRLWDAGVKLRDFIHRFPPSEWRSLFTDELRSFPWFVWTLARWKPTKGCGMSEDERNELHGLLNGLWDARTRYYQRKDGDNSTALAQEVWDAGERLYKFMACFSHDALLAACPDDPFRSRIRSSIEAFAHI